MIDVEGEMETMGLQTVGNMKNDDLALLLVGCDPGESARVVQFQDGSRLSDFLDHSRWNKKMKQLLPKV